MGVNGNLVFLRFIFIFDHVSINIKAGSPNGCWEQNLGLCEGSLCNLSLSHFSDPGLGF